MKNPTGEVEVFLKCVGKSEGDSSILDAMVLPGTNFIIDSMCIDGLEYDTYMFLENGVEFSFEDKILKAIFIYAIKVKKYRQYYFIDRLFDNIINIHDKNSIIKSIGNPDIMMSNYIKYYIDKNKYIHFEFEGSKRLKMITIGIVT